MSMQSSVRCCDFAPQTLVNIFCRGILVGVNFDDSEPQAFHFVASCLIRKKGWACHFSEINLNMQPTFVA